MSRLIDVLSKLSSRSLLTFVAYDCTAAGAGMGISAGMAFGEGLRDLGLVDTYLALLMGLLGVLVFGWRERQELS